MLIDIDKTAIAAKGRNEGVIEKVRMEAIRRTMAGLLGSRYDEGTFSQAYHEFKRPFYHPFTGDNQDVLAYICLMMGAGLSDPKHVAVEIRDGNLKRFDQFALRMEQRRDALRSAGLRDFHDAFWRRFREGKPTPFVEFRRMEYLCTAARFGGEGEPVEELLSGSIVLTQEVREAALRLSAQGALIFGISDKPDEAFFPSEAQGRRGFKPLHRLDTMAMGETPRPGPAPGEKCR